MDENGLKRQEIKIWFSKNKETDLSKIRALDHDAGFEYRNKQKFLELNWAD